MSKEIVVGERGGARGGAKQCEMRWEENKRVEWKVEGTRLSEGGQGDEARGTRIYGF